MGRAVETFAKLRNMYTDGCNDMAEAYVGQWNDLRERVASLMNDMESKNLELQTSLLTEATRLWQH